MTDRSLVVGALVAATLLFATAASAEDKTIKSVFGPGEQSTFKVEYLGMTAGTTTVTVGSDTQQFGSKVWPIVALAKTESVFRVYPVRDKFITYWDPKTQRSMGNDLFADEGSKKRRQRITVDHKSKRATVTKQDEGGDERSSDHDVDEGALDVASAAFALRNEPLEVGKEFSLPIFTGVKSFNMTAKVVGKETIDTELGSKEVFKVNVTTDFSGKMKAQRDINAYFTTDPAHVLVKLQAELVLGTIEANLVEYKEGKSFAANSGNNG
ncbi:MAG: DUF3108 domain-containing protein [Myxococcaceae bacterium]